MKSKYKMKSFLKILLFIFTLTLMMTGKQYLMGIAGGALLGGTVNGITALANGRNFMTGNLSAPVAPTTPTPSIPTKTTTPSSKVQEVLNSLEEIKANGGNITPHQLKSGQELNLTILENNMKLTFGVETHSGLDKILTE